MNIIKLNVWIFVFILLSSVAYAVDNCEVIHMDCNADYTNTGNNSVAVTNAGATIDTVTKKIGAGSCADSGGYIDLNYAPVWAAADGRSVALWLKGTATNSYFFGSTITSNAAFYARTHNSINGDFYYRDDDNNAFESTAYGTNIGDGDWHHLAYVDNGTHIRAFIDGGLDYTHTSAYPQDFSGGSYDWVLLGFNTDGSMSTYTGAGLVDDFRVYEFGISPAQVTTLYNSGSGTEEQLCSDAGDTTPPNINNDKNCTSCYANSTIWNTDEDGWALTLDNTPSVTFSTPENANCSMGQSNINYNAMIAADSNTSCLTTDTQNHSCTLPSSQKLIDGFQNITIACTDGTNENYTAPLNIHYTWTNQIPSVSSYEITPTNPAASEDLYLNVTCSDSDNNTNLSVIWKVYINNDYYTILSGRTNVSNNVNLLIQTISNSYTSHLDLINATFNCTDMYNNTIESTQIRINQYPSFTQSLPDISIANIIESLTLDTNCTDPDGDILNYSDDSALFQIDNTTGEISFTPSLSDVGGYIIEISCFDDYLTTSDSFIFNVTNTIPNITSSRIYSPTKSVYDNLKGYCTATDPENDILYYWRWYLNDDLNISGNIGNFTPGTEIYLHNISKDVLMNNQNWTFGCRAYDGLQNSSWLNSSVTTIFNYTIDNCTSTTTKTLVMTIYDENYPTDLINASFEIDIDYWIYNKSYAKNYSVSMDGGNNYSICLNPSSPTLQLDVYAKYTTATGFTHRYIIANESFNSTVKKYSIYNFNDTTGISDLKITARNKETYSYYENVIAKLQRYYTGEGVWRTIQMDQSGDFGLLFFNVKEENTDYRIIFTDRQNNILKTTNRLKFICTATICEITYLLDPYSATATPTGMIITAGYNATTENITAYWEDTLGGSNTIRFIVMKDTITGENVIHDQTQSGSSGVMTADLNGYTGEVYIRVDANGIPIISKYERLTAGFLSSTLSVAEQSFWTFAIMLVTIFFGVFSPVASIISMIIGLIIVFYLGLFTPITLTFIITAAAIGLVIGFKLKR